MKKISVIITTYNRLAILKKCLTHLTLQTFPADYFEVIICDDGSNDGTANFVRQYSSNFSLVYLHQKNNGPASARNMGIRAATGKHILFLNDDTLASPELLEQHYLAHQKTESAHTPLAVLGTFDFSPDYARLPFGYILQNTNVLFAYSGLKKNSVCEYDFFYTCNLSLPAHTLKQNLFDENFKGPAAEDIDLGYRLGKQGYKILFISECASRHEHFITPDKFCQINEMRGKWAGLFFSKHPGLEKKPDLSKPALDQWKHDALKNENKSKNIVQQLNGQYMQPMSSDRLLTKSAQRIAPWIHFLNHYHYQKGLMQSPFIKSS